MPDTPSVEEYLTMRMRENPRYKLPAGYQWNGTRVVKTWTPPTRVGGVPGAGGPGQFTIPLGGGGEGIGGGGGTPTIGTGPGYVPGIPGGTPIGSATGMPTAPTTPAGNTNVSNAIRRMAPMIAPALSLLASRGGGGGGEGVPMEDELSGLLGLQRQRMEQSGPLYDAILKMAMGLMPNSARGLLPTTSTAAPSAAAVPSGVGRTRSRG